MFVIIPSALLKSLDLLRLGITVHQWTWVPCLIVSLVHVEPCLVLGVHVVQYAPDGVGIRSGVGFGQSHDIGISALADDPGVGVEAGDSNRDA